MPCNIYKILPELKNQYESNLIRAAILTIYSNFYARVRRPKHLRFLTGFRYSDNLCKFMLGLGTLEIYDNLCKFMLGLDLELHPQ